MSIKKAKEFRDLSVDELKATLVDTRKALFDMRMEHNQAKQQAAKPHMLGKLKKEVARMLTVLTEKNQTAA